MPIREEIKIRLVDAIKSQKTLEKSVFRTILGELDLVEVRGQKITDKEAESVIRKNIVANEETLGFIKDNPGKIAQLEAEITLLKSFLPKTLSQQEILDHLRFSSTMVVHDILAADNDGKATGVAMTFFSSTPANIRVLGKDVSVVVRQIRAEGGPVKV